VLHLPYFCVKLFNYKFLETLFFIYYFLTTKGFFCDLIMLRDKYPFLFVGLPVPSVKVSLDIQSFRYIDDHFFLITL